MSSQSNFNVKYQLLDISSDYNTLRASSRDLKSQDLVKFLLKLNDLNMQLVNENDNNLIVEIVVFLSKVITKNEQKLLFLFNNLVTCLAEKSIIKLNKDELNYQFSYFFDLFRLIPSSSNASNETLNAHDLFRCIGSLIYKNASNLTKNNLEKLIGLLTSSIDINQANEKNYLILVQCIYNLTMCSYDNSTINDDSCKVKILKLLIRILYTTRNVNISENVYSRILIKSLQGIENLLPYISLISTDLVADILAVLKTISFYGLSNLQTSSSLPQQAQIRVLPLKPINNLILTESHDQSIITGGAQSDSETEQQTSKAKQSNEQQKRKRFTKSKVSNNQLNAMNTGGDTQSAANAIKDIFHQVPLLDKHYNSHASTSESEYSDNEVASAKNMNSYLNQNSVLQGNTFQIDKSNAKVRVAAINCLQTTFKVFDKRTILSYWDSFIPNDINYTTPSSLTASTLSNLTLVSILLHDYSPKVRVYATQTLIVFIDSIRNLFQIANEQHTGIQQSAAQSAFISQSYKMTIIIKNLLATLNFLIQQEEKRENYLNLIELLKCLNQLIKSIPFDKLKPGLLLKLIDFLLNYLFYSKRTFHNFAIKQASLVCITTLINLKNVEIDLILKNKLNMARFESKTGDEGSSLSGTITPQLEQLNLNTYMKQLNQNQPNKVTYFYSNSSNVLSGAHTPTISNNFNDSVAKSTNNCWLIDYVVKHALSNVEQQASQELRISCLNALISLCKNYFHLFYIDQLGQLETLFLKNLNHQLIQQQQQQEVLLTLKLLEELTRYLSTDKVRVNNQLDLNHCVKLWLRLIDDTYLIKRYLTDEKSYLICSQVCDCLAACGSDIYENLPAKLQLNLMINLLSLTKSSSNVIRAASIRALGVYITYPSLKEDFKFIYDLIDCIMVILQNDTNNLVKQKCTWSLSNLSEILIENKDKLASVFVENFNSLIFFRLLKITTEVCARESDKIKSYLVRTLGNLLSYVTDDFRNCINNDSSDDVAHLNRHVLTKQQVDDQITRSIECLIQCGSAKMLKVKWNLCHSFGIVLRNSHVLKQISWQTSIFKTLIGFLLENPNFKIKINSIIALMQLQKRDFGLNLFYYKLWTSLFRSFFCIHFENQSISDSSNEFEHKKTLIQQMCKFLTYLTRYTRLEDLIENERLMREIVITEVLIQPNSDFSLIENKLARQIKASMGAYIYDILKDNENSKQEVQLYNEALNQINLLSTNFKKSNENEFLNVLRFWLKKTDADVNIHDNLIGSGSLISNEQLHDESEVASQYLPKSTFPFKQTYD